MLLLSSLRCYWCSRYMSHTQSRDCLSGLGSRVVSGTCRMWRARRERTSQNRGVTKVILRKERPSFQHARVHAYTDALVVLGAEKLGLEETADYLGHCLGIRKKGLDPSFVQYVQRASAGKSCLITG